MIMIFFLVVSLFGKPDQIDCFLHPPGLAINWQDCTHPDVDLSCYMLDRRVVPTTHNKYTTHTHNTHTQHTHTQHTHTHIHNTHIHPYTSQNTVSSVIFLFTVFLKSGKNILFHYNNSLSKALTTLFPELGLTTQMFNNSMSFIYFYFY
jgi:hypothetical protein